MIHLALILFLFVFASPAESKILGVARADDGNTITIHDHACTKVTEQPMGFVELRDKGNTLLFEGCWYFNPQLQVVLIEWSDGDLGRVPLQFFKEIGDV